MAAEEIDDGSKRFRSPPYPAISLPQAVERAQQLFSRAQHFAVGGQVLADAWGMSVASGSLWKTAAALLHYALLTDQGAGKTRKFQLSDSARRLVQDADPNSEKRRIALQASALAPKINKELWDQFKAATGLADAVLQNYLTLDRSEGGEAPYSQQAAQEVIQNYRDSLAFAGLSSDESLVGASTERGELHINAASGTKSELGAGDLVHELPKVADQTPNSKSVSDEQINVFGKPNSGSDFSVYQVGKRLQIKANVDLEGLAKLKELLTKYEEILKLLAN